MARFRLRFHQDYIARWAGRYDHTQDDHVLGIARTVHRRRYITKEEFLSLCRWKTPRSQARCARNDPDLIEEISSVALRAPATTT